MALMSIFVTFVQPIQAQNEPNPICCAHPVFSNLLAGLRGYFKVYDARGFKLENDALFIASPISTGMRIDDFFNVSDTPEYLINAVKIASFDANQKSKKTVLLNGINKQNRPYNDLADLFWHKVTIPSIDQLLLIMHTQFEDGTNCFKMSLLLNDSADAKEYSEYTEFMQTLSDKFNLTTTNKADLGVLFFRGLPIHSFVPITETNWVLTKNGAGKLQFVRFMRLDDLIAFYKTYLLVDIPSSEPQNKGYSDEDPKNTEIIIEVKYYTKK